MIYHKNDSMYFTVWISHKMLKMWFHCFPLSRYGLYSWNQACNRKLYHHSWCGLVPSCEYYELDSVFFTWSASTIPHIGLPSMWEGGGGKCTPREWSVTYSWLLASEFVICSWPRPCPTSMCDYPITGSVWQTSQGSPHSWQWWSLLKEACTFLCSLYHSMSA